MIAIRQKVRHDDTGGIRRSLIGRYHRKDNGPIHRGTGVIHLFRDSNIGALRVDRHRGRIIGQIPIHLIGTRNRCGIFKITRGVDRRGDNESPCCPIPQRTDRPKASRWIITGATWGGCRNEAEATREEIGQDNAGSPRRPQILETDRELNRASDRGRGIINDLGDPKVHLGQTDWIKSRCGVV